MGRNLFTKSVSPHTPFPKILSRTYILHDNKYKFQYSVLRISALVTAYKPFTQSRSLWRRINLSAATGTCTRLFNHERSRKTKGFSHARIDFICCLSSPTATSTTRLTGAATLHKLSYFSSLSPSCYILCHDTTVCYKFRKKIRHKNNGEFTKQQFHQICPVQPF